MANKEKTLEGRPSIFRKTSNAAAEAADIQKPEHPDVQASKQPRIKVTFHLNPEDIIAIDTMQTEEFKQTGKKPERSQLVSRAIQNLIKQQNGQESKHPGV